jgi:hypothetical protein
MQHYHFGRCRKECNNLGTAPIGRLVEKLSRVVLLWDSTFQSVDPKTQTTRDNFSTVPNNIIIRLVFNLHRVD